jgi:hypothetical protein
VSTQVSLGPHESSLIVLDTHYALWLVDRSETLVDEKVTILQVGEFDIDALVWRFLEALSTVPGHVLDGCQGPVGEDLEIEGAVGHKDAVLDRIGR